jgi:copper chaperone CopZ
MAELTVYVTGMRCRHCVREVTARLRDVVGVETVAADMRRSQVRLGGSMTFPDVVRALVGTTYRPQIVATSSENGAEKSAENRDPTEPGQRRP